MRQEARGTDGDEEKACATSSKQTLRHRSRRNQIIIDYRSIEMEANHICSKCGHEEHIFGHDLQEAPRPMI